MSNERNVEELLKKGLTHSGQGALVAPLLDYLLLLNKWNTAYNLTAIRELESMVTKHILDSLAIVPWLHGQRLIDVGTGAGLPGIPIAIARPDIHCVLLDSNGKKIRFLNEVKRVLDLKNLEIVQFRVENYHPAERFDTVVSRAFSNIDQMIHWTSHLVADRGIWLAMKGRYPDAELSTISQPYTVKPYVVDGIEGERCCVIIDNTTEE